jgi:uncharacterized membrane protein
MNERRLMAIVLTAVFAVCLLVSSALAFLHGDTAVGSIWLVAGVVILGARIVSKT